MTKYKIHVSIDEQNFFWIIVENGKVINKNASKEDLNKITTKVYQYNKINICPRCREEKKITDNSLLYPKNVLHETNKNGMNIAEWVCFRHGQKHYQRYNSNSQHNIMKSLANCRTDNQNPTHESTKAYISQELACELYGWEDLNKNKDNYEIAIDCYDPKTELLHQIQSGSLMYNRGWFGWKFSHLEREWNKDFEDIILFCMSENRATVNEIYKMPFEEEIKEKRKSILISKNRMRNSKTLYWYEKYRAKDEDEIENANKILRKLNM